MIRITAPDYIRKSGDFKLDGLLIKKHSFEKQTSGDGIESLTMEAVPFRRMDDNQVLSYPNDVYKVVITDLIYELTQGTRLSLECKQAIAEAYYPTEKANTMIFNELCGKDLQLVWEAPQS